MHVGSALTDLIHQQYRERRGPFAFLSQTGPIPHRPISAARTAQVAGAIRWTPQLPQNLRSPQIHLGWRGTHNLPSLPIYALRIYRLSRNIIEAYVRAQRVADKVFITDTLRLFDEC